MDALKRWSLPGNIRELQNVIGGGPVKSEPRAPGRTFKPKVPGVASDANLHDVQQAERETIFSR